jgi:hypothetical protein
MRRSHHRAAAFACREQWHYRARGYTLLAAELMPPCCARSWQRQARHGRLFGCERTGGCRLLFVPASVAMPIGLLPGDVRFGRVVTAPTS